MYHDNDAVLVFEDGTCFEGTLFGAVDREQTFGEIVFNTSMSGYQEIITDPSYKGQIVVMTYPLIGNYGVNDEDGESDRPQVEGLVVRELCRHPSNHRATASLAEYFQAHGILGITGVDTRAVTRHVRSLGAMRGIIAPASAGVDSLVRRVRAECPELVGMDMVSAVTCPAPAAWNDSGSLRVAVLDCGVKYNILRMLAERDCAVMRFPADATAEEILEFKPDGMLVSNGPGDPEGAPFVFNTLAGLIGKLPVFGICFGQQMLALALGGSTYKLKFGHHGGNHPVRDNRTGKVDITVQNHGFCVDAASLAGKGVEVTHVNLNDQTMEGMESRDLRFFSVQFHPESGPGPNDGRYLFDKFVGMMKS